MVVCVRRDFAMKIDSKSLIFGILAGIVIGSIVSVALTKSLPFGFTATEQHTVTMKINSYSYTDGWGNVFYNCTGGNGGILRQTGNHFYGDNPKYQYCVIAVFIHNNVTVGSYQIWYSPVTNITLQKGDYTLNLYQGKSGLYISTSQIYVAKDIEIDV
jgi:hypothetical protein